MVPGALITGFANLALFGVVLLIRWRVHREGPSAFGLGRDGRSWRLLLQGCIAGTLAFLPYPAAAVVTGAGTVSVPGGRLAATLLLVLSWGIAFAGVALFEEALLRGYLLPKLCARFSRPTGILGQALVTAAFHVMAYSGDGVLWLGLLNAALLAALLAVVVLRTRSLMAAVGFHAMWDLSQTILLLQADGGVETAWNLRVTEGLWTGTTSTPEAGLFVTLIVVTLGALMTVAPPRSAPQRRLRDEGVTRVHTSCSSFWKLPPSMAIVAPVCRPLSTPRGVANAPRGCRPPRGQHRPRSRP